MLLARAVGAGLREELAGFGQSLRARRARGDNANDMFEASPFFAPLLTANAGRLHARVDWTAEARFAGAEERVRADYNAHADSALASGASLLVSLPQPLGRLPDLFPPLSLVQAVDTARAAASLPPSIAPSRVAHPRLHPTGLIAAHVDASAASPCERCKLGTCQIFRVAALASGPPLPIAPLLRSSLLAADQRHATYPIAPEDQVVLTAALLDYVRRGVLTQVPVGSSRLTHPVFVVYRNRYAPPPDELLRLFRAPDAFLLGHFAAFGRECISRAMASGDCSPQGLLPPSALNAALASQLTVKKARLVVDFGCGPLNDAICSWRFQFVSIADLCANIHPLWFVASADISSAFLLMQTLEEERTLEGVRWPASGRLGPRGTLIPGDAWLEFQLICNLFGKTFMPAGFSTVSAEMVQTLLRRAHAFAPPWAVAFKAYTDDIFSFAATLPIGEQLNTDLDIYVALVGAPLNDKRRPFLQRGIELLGLIADSIDVSLSLPLAKRHDISALLAVALAAAEKEVSLHLNFWEKLLGKLENASYVVPGGRGRLAYIWHAVLRFQVNGHIKLHEAPDAKSALLWWCQALASSSTCARLFTAVPAGAEMHARCDAAGDIGAGLVLGGGFASYGRWTVEAAASLSIQKKELFKWVVMLELFGDLLAGLFLPCGSDNVPNCFGVNKGSIGDDEALPWLIYLHDLADYHGVLLALRWVPREVNDLSDSISKSLSAALALATLPSRFCVAGSI